MVSGLNVLLGKVGRPVVVNGKLLTQGKTPILISRPNYSREYRLTGAGYTPVNGDAAIKKVVQEFTERYQQVIPGSDLEALQQFLPPVLDSFTGAIVLETVLFHEMAKPELHDGTQQFQAGVYELLRAFVAEYTENWFEVYIYLFNRRIAAQHMPFSVRGHFVSGLFQPLMVETKQIISPLSFGENKWMYSVLQPYEEYLHLPGENDKRISLSCVAMCDIASVFGTVTMFELDRKLWVFLVVLMLLLCLEDSRSSAFANKYPRLFSQVLANPRLTLERQGRLLTAEEQDNLSHREYATLFAHMTNYAQTKDKQLKVI